MTLLSININKIATLRNSRGGNNPDLVKTALDIIRFGAQGITVHPRPDERHIRKADVYALKAAIGETELNIEGYPSPDFIRMVVETKAAQCTLVPDPPTAITSNAGWKIQPNAKLLEQAAKQLAEVGTRTSVFIDPYDITDEDFETLKRIKVARVELYTERFALNYTDPGTITKYREAAQKAKQHGLKVNAGHDLNLDNLAALIAHIPEIDEVSIGHALVCDALYLGLQQTVARYREEIRKGVQRVSATR